ncbi:MAG: SUMF1/EgtB/PvdO family nonheme iron enzyme, partial [Bacteroidales bacterium]|nr:SUMF1/EgtB/PvdO family nonheme iron enzyme [Bacteroidales bacterium]
MKRLIILLLALLISEVADAQTNASNRKPNTQTTIINNLLRQQQKPTSSTGTNASSKPSHPSQTRVSHNTNVQTFSVNGVNFKMVKVEGGTFTMGATEEQGSEAYSDEKPTHSVTLSNYFIGETEVTQA